MLRQQLRVWFPSLPLLTLLTSYHSIGPRKLARVLMTSTANATAKHRPETKSTQDSQRTSQSRKAEDGPPSCQAEFPISTEKDPFFARRQTSKAPRKARPFFTRRHTEAQEIVAAPVSPSRHISASSSDPGTQSPTRDGKHGSFEAKSILLVEDNEINMKVSLHQDMENTKTPQRGRR